MVDEEYGLKAVHEGGIRPAQLLLDHVDILAARVPGVNFPAEQFGRHTTNVAHSHRLCYDPFGPAA